ncbi:MAG: lysylphosphatidylglycerol synthase transmembrane domain-containing protein [Planctomycetota bacterium]|jgi:uncharacterized protein (TIRG00374 family)
MRKRLVALVKILLVIALMTYVATSIDWKDKWLLRGLDEQVLETHSGRIVGAWDGVEILFEDEETGVRSSLRRGSAMDGGVVELRPGFLTYVRQMDLSLFLLATLCYLISVSVAAARWWWLLRVNELRVSLVEAVRLTWLGIFFNNVVPGQTGGDLIKALYIMKHCPDGRVPALMSVIVDRILGLAALALLGAGAVLFNFEEFRVIAVAIWSVLGVVLLIGVVAFSRRVRSMIRLDVMIAKLPGKLSGILYRMDQAVFFYRGHKLGISGWLAVSVLNHVISVIIVVLLGEAIGVGMPVATYFVLVPVITIASAVPIAPNGWGVGEALFGMLFETSSPPEIASQVMRTRGVALSVVYRMMLSILSILGGLAIFFERERVTRDDVERELALEEEEDQGQNEDAK